MNRNWFYLVALLMLPGIRILVNELHYDTWLHQIHYDRVADCVAALRANEQFQAFLGGWVFPAFVALVLVYWMLEEDKSAIPTQFLLLPLAYIPFSIIGFTLAHAEFQTSYLYVNTLIILTFGYLYVLLWMGMVALFEKLRLVD